MRVIHQGQDVQSWVNPLTHSDQDRISPYNINTIKWSRQGMRIKKISTKGLYVDPIVNSPK